MIQLVYRGPSVKAAKELFCKLGWSSDPCVQEFTAFVAINDYGNRTVHEYDADRRNWYECEMAEGATPT